MCLSSDFKPQSTENTPFKAGLYALVAALNSGDKMDCKEAIEYIHSLEKFGINPGLERIKSLCEALGNPQKGIKFVHIAGTNGKGSTSTCISSILCKAGYNTGLFISPYVTDFRERIQYNGQMIEPEILAECVSEVKIAIENRLKPKGIQPTEFEAITAAAFLCFQKKECDYVVLEVGLGGRFDSTNIIDAPCLAVITSISLDHVAILGDTIEKIAFEKSGIIKKGSRVVSYPFQDEKAFSVIKSACEKEECTLAVPNAEKISIISENLNGICAEYGNLHFNLKLAGEHMVYNACTAIEAIRALDVDISDDAITAGLCDTVMPARLELIKKEPIILLDGGHNEGCAEAVAAFIKKHLSKKRIIMLSSLMADKDVDSYLHLVAPFADKFIATKADVPRALDAETLSNLAKKYCSDCITESMPLIALEYAYSNIGNDDALVICGSFYLAGELREKILKL